MDITTLLSSSRIACIKEDDVSSKKRTFEILAKLLCAEQNILVEDDVFDALIEREKLGSTALGNGIAIPHARMPILRPRGALLSLEEGIKLDAPDKKPVKLLFALLVPEESTEEDLGMLTKLAQVLSQKNIVNQMCDFHETHDILEYFQSTFMKDVAA